MQAGREIEPSTVAHYDESYYRGQYGAVLDEDLNYQLLSMYWRDVLFVRNALNVHGKVLDFGCGIGQVSAALPDTVCFDFNSFALSECQKRARVVIEHREDIPRGVFDCVLSSHSLEHSPTPCRDLEDFREYVRPNGRIILVLPIETNLQPALQPDWNRHLQAWTFQTITNLLFATGWTPLSQSMIYGPFMLRTLGRRLPPERSVHAAYMLGRLRRGGASMLTIAKVS